MKRFRRATAMLLSMLLFFGSTSAVVFAENTDLLSQNLISSVEQ